MSAIAFTKIGQGQNQLVYSWTGDSAGTLAYSTWSADCPAGSAILAAATALGGTCDTDAKAQLAISGCSAGGGQIPAGGINVTISYTAVTTAKAPVTVAGKDSGAGNNPDILLTPDAATSGILIIRHYQSSID